MNTRIRICFFAALLGLAFWMAGFSSAISSRELVQKMLDASFRLKTARYHLKVMERVRGKFHSSESLIKLNANPRKVYLKNPHKGTEVLWVEGQNKGDAWVNPGKFPYVTLSLDPRGDLMFADQHHSIHEIGFAYFAEVIRRQMQQSGEEFSKQFIYTGEEKWQSYTCYKLTIINHGFSWINYVVPKEESLQDLASGYALSEYMIFENNAHLPEDRMLRKGMQIRIPTDYAKMTVLLIEKSTFLPVSIKVYDDAGLFESYEYLDLKANVFISDEEFAREYKDYKF